MPTIPPATPSRSSTTCPGSFFAQPDHPEHSHLCLRPSLSAHRGNGQEAPHSPAQGQLRAGAFARPNDYEPYTIRYVYDAVGNFTRNQEYSAGALHYKSGRIDLFNGDTTEAGSFTDLRHGQLPLRRQRQYDPHAAPRGVGLYPRQPGALHRHGGWRSGPLLPPSRPACGADASRRTASGADHLPGAFRISPAPRRDRLHEARAPGQGSRSARAGGTDPGWVRPEQHRAFSSTMPTTSARATY